MQNTPINPQNYAKAADLAAVALHDRIAGARWSSWPEYLKGPSQRSAWLRVDRLLGKWGIRADNASGWRQLETGLEQRRELELSQPTGEWEKLRRGWCCGSNAFRAELLQMIAARQGEHHYGEEFAELDEQKAKRLVEQLL